MSRLRKVLPRLSLAALLALAIGFALATRERFEIGAIAPQIAALGIWAPLAYIALYVAATVAFLPGSILGIAGGALFGPFWGAAYTLIGATVGATLAFLIARYVASDWIARKAVGPGKWLIDGVEAEGWRFVAFVRLVPLLPFNLLNYALGLTRIPLLDYAVASFICMAPGTIAYTYLGYAGREALAGEAMVKEGLIALALVALAVFLPRFVRRVRHGTRPETHTKSEVSWVEAPQLADRLRRGPAPTIVDVRGSDEFNGDLGHIAGTRNLPLGDLPRRMGELEPLKAGEVVLVCRTQIRSAKAASLLRDAGFTRVAVLHGGMVEWVRQGHPVEGCAGPSP
jgi:uncharacterized membrane protein YdjX (TVP38/TMEM64 family)/rhodanese-related sulfurtransferase